MLTDVKIRSLKPNGKIQKVSDGEGLHVLVSKTGALLWRLAYRFGGKQKTLCLGQYPAVTLAAAREAKRDALQLLSKGIDPAAQKQKEKSGKSGENADAVTPVGNGSKPRHRNMNRGTGHLLSHDLRTNSFLPSGTFLSTS